jgi:adenine-specific DNA methylase
MAICTIAELEATRAAALRHVASLSEAELEEISLAIERKAIDNCSLMFARALTPNAPRIEESMAAGFKSKAYKDWMLGVGPVPESAKKLGFQY